MYVPRTAIEAHHRSDPESCPERGQDAVAHPGHAAVAPGVLVRRPRDTGKQRLVDRPLPVIDPLFIPESELIGADDHAPGVPGILFDFQAVGDNDESAVPESLLFGGLIVTAQT